MSDDKSPKGPKGNNNGKDSKSKNISLNSQRKTFSIPGDNKTTQENLNKGFELRPIPEKPKK